MTRPKGHQRGWLVTMVIFTQALTVGGTLSTAAASNAVAEPEPSEASRRPVRLLAMTFNPDEKGDDDGIADVIHDAVGRTPKVAGVAGLQELCKDERKKVIDKLRAKSGRSWRSAYQLNDRGGGRPPWVCENGNAVVTTQSMSGIALVPYRVQHPEEKNKNKEIRGYVRASIRVGSVTVHVYSTHLTAGSGHDRQAVRRAQVAQLVQDIKREDVRGPRVVLGDFNATPGAAELAPLYELLQNVGPSTPTTAKDIGPCPPQGERQRKIDHIFVSKSVKAVRSYVPRLTDDENPSDGHCPVIAELHIPRR